MKNMKRKILALTLAITAIGSAAAFSGCAGAQTAGEAVAGIMNNANAAEMESNAAELTSAIRTLYAGTAGGTINNKTPQDELNNLSPSKLPDPALTPAEAKESAAKLTVQDAIDYQGLTSYFNSQNIAQFGYAGDGSVYYAATYKGSGDLQKLTLSTTLGKVTGKS